MGVGRRAGAYKRGILGGPVSAFLAIANTEIVVHKRGEGVDELSIVRGRGGL